MKRILILTVVLALSLVGVPMAAQTQGGTIEGTAKDSSQNVLAGVTVQLRNVDTGALAGTMRSGADGSFSFKNIIPGNYVVELVASDGTIIGVTASIAVASGATVTGVSLAASAAVAVGGGAAAGGAVAGSATAGGAAAGGAAAGGTAAAGGAGSFFTSTAGLAVLGAAAAGTAAAVVVANRTPASGSR